MTKTEWQKANECFPLIANGMGARVIEQAKIILRKERWNPDAHACLAMSYYGLGNTESSLRKLRDAEDNLPKESVDALHDLIWNYMPELLAEKEYRSFYALSGGDCILRNLTAIEGSGYLLLGSFYHPEAKKVIRHVRGYRCGKTTDKCEEVDKVCPGCVLEEAEARIEIADYRISRVWKLKKDSLFRRNLAYVKKILELQRTEK